MTDIFAKAHRKSVATAARDAGIYPSFSKNSAHGSRDAMSNGHELIMFGSCNYLGLANHPDVKAAVRGAVDTYGTCSAGSRVLTGNLDVHLELEELLAAYLGREACLIFTSGYLASEGVISALAQPNDVVALDQQSHPSCVAGAQLSGGTLVRFRHNSVADLETVLREHSADHGVLVVVDGVYSMTGEVAPLREIGALKKRYEFRLLIDDAHGTGVLGKDGRGTAEHLGAEQDVDLIVGSFGKSFGTTGGFVAGPRIVLDYLKHTAGSLVESTSMTPGDAAAAAAALAVSSRDHRRRRHVTALAELFRRELREVLGSTGAVVVDSPSAIVAVVIGDELTTLCYWRQLFDAGLYVNPMVTPAVPAGKATLRISCTAEHTETDVRGAIAAFRRVGPPEDAVARAGQGLTELTRVLAG